jgi:filamentous hemagglutinin family protein
MKPNLAHRISTKRRALLLSCASLAIATAALAPQKARAQAFQGTPTTIDPVTFDRATPGVETITVNSGTATINWSPSDVEGTGNINFLPSGNIATYQGGEGLPDYTVLNRIVPTDATRMIELNGSVLAKLAGGATGGKVWFYSPGGIVIGATATFDVGGLLLSSLDVTSFGSAVGGSGFSATFAPFEGTTPGAIQILDGAQINALEQNSYVALVAPRVEQGGSVKVDGSAAYVAATNLTMTMNQGLFDIQVDVGGGTDDVNGIVHTGTTTGGATASLSDNHKIYMVAVPKNQALTMLLGGTVGYDASTAGYDNGQIVLSAGWSIGDTGTGYDPNTEYVVDAGIDIGPGSYLSDLFAIARGDINAIADTGNIDFAGNVSFNTYDAANTGNVALRASNGYDLNVGGNVSMLTSNPANFSQASIYADGGAIVDIGGNVIMVAGAGEGDGGDASITAGGQSSGGTVNIDGTVDINVDGQYFSAATTDSSAGTAYGGDINITAYNDGVITTGGLTLNANAYGQDSLGGYGSSSESYSGFGGSGYGGDVYINADGGGTITVNGDLTARAQGSGGNTTESGNWGGTGDGGDATLSVGDGAVNVTGDVTLSASAWGGTGGSQSGGDAWGGYANINSYGPGSITIGGSTDLRAEATGGDGQSGGAGYGGSAGAYGYAGTIALGSYSYVSAQGLGGDAILGFGGTGGYGEGGVAFIEADASLGEGGTSQGTITGGDAIIDASGTGGAGGAGDGVETLAGAGGDGVGGYYDNSEVFNGAFALAQTDGATLTLANVSMLSIGTGGAGGTGGEGQTGGVGGAGYGGTAQAGLYDPYGTAANTGTATYGNITANAGGLGGAGGVGAAGLGDGGDGWGGEAYVNAKGTVDAVNATLLAGAAGGAGANGGDAFGGWATIEAYPGSTMTFTGNVEADAWGSGGEGIGGDGGAGTGGTASLTITDGSTAQAGTMLIWATGVGGNSDSGAAGSGTGGTASVLVAGTGSLTGTQLFVFADAGGGISASGAGGSANAGDATLTIDGGTVSVHGETNPGVYVTADAMAGSGVTGGSAVGGTATLQFTDNGGNLSSSYLELHSFGFGGDGSAAGGDGTGGIALFDVAPLNSEATAQVDLNSIFISALGEGGDALAVGGTGGTGSGGSITVNFGAASGTGSATTYIAADGTGGAGEIAGTSYGGSVSVWADDGASLDLGVADVSALGTGGFVSLGVSDCSCTGGLILADSLTVNSGGDFVLGNLTASGDMDLSAAGLADFWGIISAPTIAVTSSDIDIAFGATLGVEGVTNLLTLNAVSDQSIIIGDQGVGPAFAGQYVLNEDGDIRANTVVINALSANEGPSPDIVVYDLHMDGSQSADGGHVSDVTLNTGGSILVEGIVDFVDVGASDSLTLNAGDTIEVNTDTVTRATSGSPTARCCRSSTKILTSPGAILPWRPITARWFPTALSAPEPSSPTFAIRCSSRTAEPATI